MPTDSHFANGRMLPVLLDRILLALSVVIIAILFAWLLCYGRCSLDLRDEGFYLNYVANPFAHAISVPPSLFAFVYRWLYQWAGGDIAVFRMANVTLSIALDWILSFLVIQRLWTVGSPQAAVLSGEMASMALVSFCSWLLLTRPLRTERSISLDSDDRLAASRSVRAHPGRLGVDPGRRWRLVLLHGEADHGSGHCLRRYALCRRFAPKVAAAHAWCGAGRSRGTDRYRLPD